MQRRQKHEVPPLHLSWHHGSASIRPIPNFPLSIVAIEAFINIFIKKNCEMSALPNQVASQT